MTNGAPHHGLLQMGGLSRRAVSAVALASGGGLAVAMTSSWPLWGVVLAAAVPWGVVVAGQARWLARRHDAWLALFYVLVVSQGGHLLEHVVQVAQVHVLGMAPPDANGVFTALDAEWVHFLWNTWVLAATVPLVLRYRDNSWLRLAAVAAVWHELEHAYLIVGHVMNGTVGDPGLLAGGGALGGGVPVTRIDLHVAYNVIETLPIVVAFGVTLRREQAPAPVAPGGDDVLTPAGAQSVPSTRSGAR